MKILINGIEWDIKEAGANDSMLLHNGSRCNGTTHFIHKEIYLVNDLNQSFKYQILCHELTHAFLFETQISDYEKIEEESVCDFVGIYGKNIIEIANEYFGR